MQSSLDTFPALAAFLAGSPVRWADLRIDEDALLQISENESLSTLMFHRLSRLASREGWPASVREALSSAARVQTGEELLRRAETRAVLTALADAGVRPLLIKGTALAYSLYDAPSSRPRADTDLLIDEADIDAARAVLTALEYQAPDYCADLFSQFEMEKRDAHGVTHVFDVHWKISTQPVFQDVLTYRDVISRAEPLPALGPHAAIAGPVDALLLACVHPVMHHRNEERALWVYDIHLLAQRLSPDQLHAFAALACAKKVAAVCAHELRRAQTLFKTTLPPAVLAQLARAGHSEPSAAYLASERRWHHELVSSVRGLPSLGARMRLLREVLLPAPDYMLGIYGLRGKPLAPWLLPALYLHRSLRGVWKIVSGKK